MGKHLNLILILTSLLSLNSTSQTLISGHLKKVTKLQFYVHDIIGGDRPTVWTVAKSNLTDVLPSQFGRFIVFDDPVTWNSDINSRRLGRMQGTVALSDLREQSLAMLINLVFTDGKLEGSTLSFVGRNPLQREEREFSIVAGTGVFRMATGYVIASTYFTDPAGVTVVFEYNAFVYHYDEAFFLSR